MTDTWVMRSYRSHSASTQQMLDDDLRRLHERSSPVVAAVRSRLVEQGAVDAVAALDGLSTTERYLLAVREAEA